MQPCPFPTFCFSTVVIFYFFFTLRLLHFNESQRNYNKTLLEKVVVVDTFMEVAFSKAFITGDTLLKYEMSFTVMLIKLWTCRFEFKRIRSSDSEGMINCRI